MKRRHVVALPFGMALARPRTMLAQPAQRVYRVGLVAPTSAGARSEAFLAYGDGFVGKWLDLLKEVSPRVTQFAALWSSSNPAAARFMKELQTMARSLNVRIDSHLASTAPAPDASLAAIASSAARGLIVMPSPFAVSQKETLVQFAANRRLPAIYFVDDFAVAGGLLVYGPSVTDSYRRAATHVDKILKGAKPADLPVEQSTRFELFVNRKTAKALGLTIPQALLLRADEVIQ